MRLEFKQPVLSLTPCTRCWFNGLSETAVKLRFLGIHLPNVFSGCGCRPWLPQPKSVSGWSGWQTSHLQHPNKRRRSSPGEPRWAMPEMRTPRGILYSSACLISWRAWCQRCQSGANGLVLVPSNGLFTPPGLASFVLVRSFFGPPASNGPVTREVVEAVCLPLQVGPGGLQGRLPLKNPGFHAMTRPRFCFLFPLGAFANSVVTTAKAVAVSERERERVRSQPPRNLQPSQTTQHDQTGLEGSSGTPAYCLAS